MICQHHVHTRSSCVKNFDFSRPGHDAQDHCFLLNRIYTQKPQQCSTAWPHSYNHCPHQRRCCCRHHIQRKRYRPRRSNHPHCSHCRCRRRKRCRRHCQRKHHFCQHRSKGQCCSQHQRRHHRQGRVSTIATTNVTNNASDNANAAAMAATAVTTALISPAIASATAIVESMLTPLTPHPLLSPEPRSILSH
jgi:hypothetical protein